MDTLVSTEDGLRPIEEIQAGDYVWSENTETGKKELKKVLSVSVTETTTLVHVTTENGTVINTTENHPFYVEGKGWCAAAELETGDVLRTEDGEQETVKSVQTEKLDKAVKVYNLEIEDSHTYYVSADRVLVHNACKDAIIEATQKYENFQCVETAEEIKGIILKAGGTGYLVEIHTDTPYIWSDNFNMAVSKNGYHVGVEYDGKIYDNIYKNGIDIDMWMQDLIHTVESKMKRTKF